MSGGSSNSESISECEFEANLESDKESIRGCYNNKPEYSQEEIRENIECLTQNAVFAILHLSKLVLETACIRTQRYNKKFRDILVFTNK